MPTIDILENSAGRAKSVEAPEGGDFLDLCDEHYLPVPFSCRSATCATCHVEVLSGAELLEPAAADELETLSYLGGPKGSRLGCQIRIKAQDGLVQLKPLG